MVGWKSSGFAISATGLIFRSANDRLGLEPMLAAFRFYLLVSIGATGLLTSVCPVELVTFLSFGIVDCGVELLELLTHIIFSPDNHSVLSGLLLSVLLSFLFDS